MLLGKLQKAQKLPHLLYLHQIFWVSISFLKRYEKSSLLFLGLSALGYCHVEMALHYKLCSLGMVIFLLYSCDLFQVGAEPAPQAGVVSADIGFKDMTSHCEALTIGKQQKMSAFMSFQQSVQAAGLPSSQPNQMELDLSQDPQLPQVEYLPLARPFIYPQ